MSWSGDVEGEHEGTHKYLIQSRLWQLVRVKGWRHIRRKRVTHELMPHAHKPRYLEGLEKSTLGGHRVHTGLLAWGHHGQLQELLVWLWEKFSPFLPMSLLSDA